MTALLAKFGAVLVLVIGGLALSSPPSAGNTPGCVTQHEFEKVHQRQKMATVHDIFDTHGRYVDSITDGEGRNVVRSYRKCAGFDGGRGRVGVRFDNHSGPHIDGCDCPGMRFDHKARKHPSSLIWW